MKKKNLLLTIIAIIGFVCALRAQVPSYVPTNGLVAWYPFNGNNNDESGIGNNLTNSGATLTSDRFGYCNSAYNFQSTQTMGKTTSNTNGVDFTYSHWIKGASNVNYNSNLGETDGVSSSGGNFETVYMVPQYICQGINVNVTNSTFLLNVGTWYHLVLTKSSNLFSIYINGVLNSQGSSSFAPFNASTYFVLGGVDTDIDDVGMWNRVLTQTEITALYTAPGTTPSTITQPTNQTVNINNSVQFVTSSSNVSATFQWQTDLGVGFQNLNNVGQYSGVTNDTLNIANTTMGNNNQPFRCIITSGICPDTTNTAVLTVITNTGINELNNSQFKVYPNPAKSQINVQANTSLIGSSYSITDQLGKTVLAGKFTNENTSIELNNLTGGVYLFSVGENMKQTFKVIKE